MENLSVNAATSSGKKRQHSHGVDDNSGLPSAKKHLPDPVANQHGEYPANEYDGKCIKFDRTTTALPSVHLSQEEKSLYLRSKLKAALIHTACKEDDSQQEINGQLLEQILDESDFRTYMTDSIDSSNPSYKYTAERLKKLITPFNIPPDNLSDYTDAMINHLICNTTHDLNLLFGLMLVLFRHPSIKEYKPLLENTGGISERLYPWLDKSDVGVLKFILLFDIASADMLLMQYDNNFFTRICSEFLCTDSYFTSLWERAVLFEKISPPYTSIDIVSLLFLCSIWWQETVVHDNSYQTTSNLHLKKKLTAFINQQFMPDYLNAIIFDVNNPCSKFVAVPPDKKFPYSQFHYLCKEEILFGEEFEYEMPIIKSDDVDFEKYTTQAMRQWKKTVENIYPEVIISEKGFDNTDDVNGAGNEGSDSPDDTVSTEDDSNEEDATITAALGNWEVQAKPEPAAENGYPVIEFTASPYAISQQFLLGEKQYSAYELLQKFVIEPAKENGWIECSGHKHLDIKNSIGNNTELLFRLLVAIENKAWLATITQQARYAKKYFPYIVQMTCSKKRRECLQSAIKAINKSVSLGKKNAQGNPFIKLSQLDLWWKMLTSSGMNQGPGTIRYGCISTPDAALKNKVRDPDSTIEFRFFHGSRSAEEVKLINQLLVAWLEDLSRQQQEKQPLAYEPVDPTGISHEEAVARFKVFTAQLGLEWESYKMLIRHPE